MCRTCGYGKLQGQPPVEYAYPSISPQLPRVARVGVWAGVCVSVCARVHVSVSVFVSMSVSVDG